MSEAPAGDVIAWSLAGLLAMSFPKSRLHSYDAAVNVARQAQHYAEQHVGKTLMHFAGFGRSREQMARALSVVRGLRSAKGFQIYAGGQLLAEWHRVEVVLRCILQSMGNEDPHSHCVMMVTDRFVGAGQRGDASRLLTHSQPLDLNWDAMMNLDLDAPAPADRLVAFPCRYLLYNRQFRFQPGHPASEPEQLHAAAVREGCDWCPNFQTHHER